MGYRYEVNGEAFGNMFFKSREEAEDHLKGLLERSEARYKRAVLAKHYRTTKALRQNVETYQNLIKIVPVTDSTVGMALGEQPVKSETRTEYARYSSRLRNYMDVA